MCDSTKNDNLEEVSKSIIKKEFNGEKCEKKTITKYQIKKKKESFLNSDTITLCIVSVLICTFFLFWGYNEQQARINYLAKHETMDSVYITKKELSDTLRYYVLRDSLENHVSFTDITKD